MACRALASVKYKLFNSITLAVVRSTTLAFNAKLPVTAEKTLAVVKYKLPPSETSDVDRLLTVFSMVAVMLAVALIWPVAGSYTIVPSPALKAALALH